MEIIRNGATVRLVNAADFSPQLIFECGQAFRWKRDASGAYTGIAMGAPLKVIEDGGAIVLKCADEMDFDRIWSGYFDLGLDYGEIRKSLASAPKLAPAVEYGCGIRILRQDFWEALCSFLISQCNNIPRIKGIVESLCRNFGSRVEFEGAELYTFPEPGVIAALSPEELDVIRSGYRAKYLIHAAQAIVSGEISAELLRSMDTRSAREALMGLQGVGRKVADCVLLYGLGRMEVYPIDVWMKRVSQEFFGDTAFDGSCFGEYAGLAQQYLFHYIRALNGKTQ